MARITSEVAMNQIGNKYLMILIAAVRAREIRRGSKSLVESSNGPCITALREIEQGEVTKDFFRKSSRK